jgi:hypothetical protein
LNCSGMSRKFVSIIIFFIAELKADRDICAI